MPGPIPPLPYAEHMCEGDEATKEPQEPSRTAQEPVNGANGSKPGPVYALFDQKAVARLESTGAEIARLRQELRDEQGTFTTAARVERCREIARLDCLQMAFILDQLVKRFALIGSGAVFLRNLRPSVVADALSAARNEMARLGDPAVWRIA